MSLILWGPIVVSLITGLYGNVRFTIVIKKKSRLTRTDACIFIVMFFSTLIVICYILPYVWDHYND